MSPAPPAALDLGDEPVSVPPGPLARHIPEVEANGRRNVVPPNRSCFFCRQARLNAVERGRWDVMSRFGIQKVVRHGHPNLNSTRIFSELRHGTSLRPVSWLSNQSMGRPSNRLEKRREILDAFARVLADHGYAGATIASIALEAGIAPGLVHHHFDNKAELLSGLLQDLVSRFRSTPTRCKPT
jgi:Bacterial regulatory proteins, tetR family